MLGQVRLNEFINKDELIQFQLESYNQLLETGLQEVIKEKSSLEIDIPDYTLELGGLKIKSPRVNESGLGAESRKPFECRIRNLTYAAPLNLEFIECGEPVNVEIGYLPVMVKSEICLLNGLSPDELVRSGEDPLDPGGYFIINGTERSLIIVEDLAPNRIVVTRENIAGKQVILSKVFSVRQGFRSRVTVEKRETRKSGTLFTSFPGIPKRISLVVMMKALGMSDEDILALFPDEEMKRYTSRIKDMEDREEERREELDTLKNSLSEYDEELDKASEGMSPEKRLRNLESELSNVQNEHYEKLRTLGGEYISRPGLQDREDHEIKVILDRIDDLEEQKQKHQDEIHVLQALIEKEDLENEVKKKEESISRLEKKMQEQKEEIKSLRGEISHDKNRLADLARIVNKEGQQEQEPEQEPKPEPEQ